MLFNVGFFCALYWKEKLLKEVMVFFKTTKKLYDALESKIKELHPYQVPEIIAIDIERGLPDYLKWIDTVTAQ